MTVFIVCTVLEASGCSMFSLFAINCECFVGQSVSQKTVQNSELPVASKTVSFQLPPKQ
jgi:hypothetical protein